jgi:rhodanese-related sulfurtransferase
MNMKKSLLFLFALLTMASAACQPKSVAGETIEVSDYSYRNISADELNTILKAEDFLLINVHIPFAGNIAGTDLSIPYDQIKQNLSQLPAAKNAKIVVYCSSGRMSRLAAETLIALGYTNIWNLKGGMVEWEQAGYEIEK